MSEVYLRTVARILMHEPGEVTETMVRKWYPRMTKPRLTGEGVAFVMRMVAFNRRYTNGA